MAQPDMYGLLMGDDLTAEEQARLMASTMRGRQDLGELALLTGDPVLSQFGRAAAQRGAGEQGLLNNALGDRAQRRFQAQQQTERLRSSERLGRAPPFVIVTGEGGQQYFVNPRNPGQTAQPVMGPDGKPITKPQAHRPIPQSEREALTDAADQLRSLGSLQSSFKSDFAGGGPLGGLATAGYQWLGSLGSSKMQQDAAWWTDFNRLVDLPERNKVFGASLSSGEKASWEAAKNIKPGSDPKQVQDQLTKMQDILHRKLGARTEALEAEGFNPDAIRALSGSAAPQQAPLPTPSAPAPAGVRETKPGKDGAMYEKTPQGWRKVK